VEKNLKGMLVDKDIDIPRTHNILDLCNAAKKVGHAVPISDEDAIFLNSIYRARYPADLGLMSSGEPTGADAEKALMMARRIVGWLKK
jgi:HEPN domain-containing protein